MAGEVFCGRKPEGSLSMVEKLALHCGSP